MHARTHSVAAAPPAMPELRLQVIDRHSVYRECNYSLYPSWLAYPWPNAHLLIRGTRPWAIDRCDRTALRSEIAAASSMLEAVTQYHENLDAAALAAILWDFAASTPRPAKILLNLNTGAAVRRVSGQLGVLGCRAAAVGKHGELSALAGMEFSPALGSEPGGPARTAGLRVRHRILIQPGTRLRLVLPLALAEAARRRPRPGQRIEQIEPLPSVFADPATLRSLWPKLGQARPGQRYRLDFADNGNGALAMQAVALAPVPAVETAEPLVSPA